MKPETVGQRIKRLRMSRPTTDPKRIRQARLLGWKGLPCMSQRELAEPGISHAYISRLEADTRKPSVKALRKLAPKLNVSVEYLETGEDLVSVLVSRTVAVEALARLEAARKQDAEVRGDPPLRSLTRALKASLP